MSLRTDLPAVKVGTAPKALSFDIPQEVQTRFADAPHAEAPEGDERIWIMEQIGEDYWTGGGVTAKGVKERLAGLKGKPVTVLINSPGGDVFEGIAIYNLLRMHQGEITVQIVGLAASAASIIAMAGDRIEIARGGFVMIHNAWVCTCGNRHDMRDVADYLEPFDAALREVYAARTGLADDEIEALMDAETWMTATTAVEKGFADARVDIDLPEPAAKSATVSNVHAKRTIDAALAAKGMTRRDRRELMNSLSAGMHDAAPESRGKPRAAPHATHDAGELMAAIRQCLTTLQS